MALSSCHNAKIIKHALTGKKICSICGSYDEGNKSKGTSDKKNGWQNHSAKKSSTVKKRNYSNSVWTCDYWNQHPAIESCDCQEKYNMSAAQFKKEISI